MSESWRVLVSGEKRMFAKCMSMNRFNIQDIVKNFRIGKKKKFIVLEKEGDFSVGRSIFEGLS